MDAGLLPIKDPKVAKQRLSSDLGERERIGLATALALDALDLSARCGFLDWWVVSDDPLIRESAERHGFRTIADDGEGLNAALSMGLDQISAAGADSVTILPADLPLALPEDVRDILDTIATSQMVLVPSGGDGGTNALAMSPPQLLEPRFGEGSLAAHISTAEKEGLRCSVLASERLALDLDTMDDIDVLLRVPDAPRGRAFDLCSLLVRPS